MEILSIPPFLKYFSNVRERTLRVARCIPPEKIDWSYAPGKFTFDTLARLGPHSPKRTSSGQVIASPWIAPSISR